MSIKNWLSIAFVLVLAGTYIVYFTDWFQPATVDVFHTVREVRWRQAKTTPPPSLIFGLSRKLQLTELRVVRADQYATNKTAACAWHLISDSNSVPLKSFIYGQSIQGMRPAIKGTRPDELQPNTTYSLIVRAGKVQGEHQFDWTNAPARN